MSFTAPRPTFTPYTDEAAIQLHRRGGQIRSAARSFRAASLATAAGMATTLWPGAAAAHAGTGLAGGFAAGFLHPFQGPDHLLAMVSVGIWGAFLGRPLIVALPVIFPSVMAVGAVIGMTSLRAPGVEIGIALSVLTLGAAIASAYRAPVWAACLVVGLFGLFHGYAHGHELPSAADPAGYSTGFIFGTGLLHILGVAIGYLIALPNGRLIIRLLGLAISGAGVYYLIAAVR
ncbi:MAG: HupE/UreJ family protein [Pseudomonadota bacterium]